MATSCSHWWHCSFYFTMSVAPICKSKNSNESKNMVEWTHMVRLLSSNGFVSFVNGLHFVLDGILQDHPYLNFRSLHRWWIEASAEEREW
ncbi:hypothetical protein ACSBR2_039938 [Camellia fascicularis]